jgi:LCP family protein required for cell wall assembly
VRFLGRHKALSVLGGLVLVLVVATGAWVVTLNKQLSDIPRFDAGLDRPDRPTRVEGEALNILLVGVDDGKGNDLERQLRSGSWVEGSFRSDTMMVWHLSADRRHSEIVSLPRDSWVDIPGRGKAKLNAAFSYGGPGLLARTLEDSFGVYIDNVAVVDFEGFKGVTRTLGGVEVPMSDGSTSRLEGDEALDYVRARKSLPNGDFDRIRRQQHFLRSVLQQTMAGRQRINPVRVTRLAGDMAELLVLDDSFTNGRIRGLATTLGRKGPGRITWLTAPTDGTGREGAQSVVRLDVEMTRELFAAIEDDEFEDYREQHGADVLPSQVS